MIVQKPHHPIEVKILTIAIACLGLWNTLRIVQAIFFWDFISRYCIRNGPLYLGISGGIWAATSFVLAWASWQGKPWAWGTMLGTTVGFVLWMLVDRFFLQESRQNEPFVAMIEIVLFVFFILLFFSGNVRGFYHGQ
jgi:hypothetical protein